MVGDHKKRPVAFPLTIAEPIALTRLDPSLLVLLTDSIVFLFFVDVTLRIRFFVIGRDVLFVLV